MLNELLNPLNHDNKKKNSKSIFERFYFCWMMKKKQYLHDIKEKYDVKYYNYKVKEVYCTITLVKTIYAYIFCYQILLHFTCVRYKIKITHTSSFNSLFLSINTLMFVFCFVS